MKMKKLSLDRIDCPSQVEDWIRYGKNTDWG